jgi:hypothetical protein
MEFTDREPVSDAAPISMMLEVVLKVLLKAVTLDP